MLVRHLVLWSVFTLAVSVPQRGEASIVVQLVHEFDGNSNGTASFGSVSFQQGNAGTVDVTVIADTANLGGGDIHQLYFNLSSSITGLVVSNVGGVSNRAIQNFSVVGPSPSVRGGAGSSFDWGISFGNGGGPPGNGTLTTATFTLSADQSLSVSDFTSELSSPNNTPPVYLAVHFQDTNIFGETSETVGGVPSTEMPEPGSLVCWILVGALGLLIGWAKRRN